MKKDNQISFAYEHVTHTFGPVYDEHSELLILGSMPSVKSREQQFYYGHAQNRFWKVLAQIFDETIPQEIEKKRVFLLRNKIALWDVIASCDIVGSSDSSIKNVKENDMRVILDNANIQAIFLNGGKAYELFMKYCQHYIQKEALKLVKLPSTSPANALWSLERLTDAWKKGMDAIFVRRCTAMQNDQQKKYRTRHKDAIVSYLEQHSEHSFSAYDVNEYMQENGIQVNLTTIYRNLDKLIENGAIMKYKTAEDECCRYQCVKPHAQCYEHIHMQCKICGKILHLECCFMEEITKHLYEHHKFLLECAGSVLMGVCEECQTKVENEI